MGTFNQTYADAEHGWGTRAGFWDANDTFVFVGNNGGDSDGGFRATNVTIPKNARIISAIITVDNNTENGTPDITVYGVLGDATAFSNSNVPNDSPKTITSVDYDAIYTGGGVKNVDVTAIVQEIVDGTWVSGNALGIVFINEHGTTGNYNQYENNASSGSPPTISIIYSSMFEVLGGGSLDTGTVNTQSLDMDVIFKPGDIIFAGAAASDGTNINLSGSNLIWKLLTGPIENATFGFAVSYIATDVFSIGESTSGSLELTSTDNFRDTIYAAIRPSGLDYSSVVNSYSTDGDAVADLTMSLTTENYNSSLVFGFGLGSITSWTTDPDFTRLDFFHTGSGLSCEIVYSTEDSPEVSFDPVSSVRMIVIGLKFVNKIATSTNLYISGSGGVLNVGGQGIIPRRLTVSGSSDLTLVTSGSQQVTYTMPEGDTTLLGTNIEQSFSNKSGSFLQIQIPATGSNPTGSTPTQGDDVSTMIYDTGSDFLFLYSAGSWESASFV